MKVSLVNNCLGLNNEILSLAGVSQWIEHRLQISVAGLIPRQGTCLGCGPGNAQQGARERQPHIDVSLPLFLLPFPSP